MEIRKSIAKRLLDQKRSSPRSSGGQQLYLNFDKLPSKTTSNVKAHTKKTKSGKLALVKQHQRVNNTIKKFKKLKVDAMKRALTEARKYSGKKASTEVVEEFHRQLKTDIIKLIAKEMKYAKGDPQLRRKAQILFDNASRVTGKIFNNKRLGIKWTGGNVKKMKTVTKEIKQKPKVTSSKFAFGYFGTGDPIDNSGIPEKLLFEGYTFYNQNIQGDKNWQQTLKRKDLKILQLGKSAVSGNKKFDVTIMMPVKGKLKVKNLGFKESSEIVKIIKGK